MNYKLGGEAVPYSDNEYRAFDFLPKNGKPISTVDLTEQIYSDRKRRPYHARQVVLGVVTALKKKIAANREPFHIARTERSGPHPVEFWLEPGRDPETKKKKGKK